MSDETRLIDVALIGVDWGTSNLRVMRIGAGGVLLETRSDPRGAGVLEADAFSGVLAQVAGEWLQPGLPVLVCGTAGGRGKWSERPYIPCPIRPVDLAASVLGRDDGGPCIVSGVMAMRDGQMSDVMRGEETQVAGLDLGPGDHLVVAPGTHSKWIEVRDGVILDFRSFMTGELFAAIRKGTIMGQGMGRPGLDDAAFVAGVRRGMDDPALTAVLFSVRIETMADRLSVAASADYLSGLLIGAEVAVQADMKDRTVVLLGTETLNSRYQTALQMAGFSDVRCADADAATALGLWRIHEAMP